MKEKEPSEDVQRLLREVCDHFSKEDRAVRDRQIREWRKLKYYWNGFQRIWWSETAHDWRVYDLQNVSSPSDGAYYDKPINVFKAYLESIIAALSINIPGIKCFPDDANNSLDLQTARAGDKICELVGRHNDVSLLWLHALFILCTEGMIAAHHYTKSDESYGTYDIDKYEDEEQDVTNFFCSLCGTQLTPQDQDRTETEADEFHPGNDDVLSGGDKPFCANCLQQVDPELRTDKVIVTHLVGKTKEPKSRQIIECYGGLFVKVANYAQNQEGTPYLQWAYETHYANVLERYEHLRGKIEKSSNSQSQGGYNMYEQWGRIPTNYFNEYPIHNATVQNWWLRPASFNILRDEDDIKMLKKKYPDGCKVVFINEFVFAEAENCCLDDEWTLSYNPLSDYIHHDPLGKLLTSVQEITNDLVSLVLQTIEHGIPQTFADPAVVIFDAYSQMEASPGSIIPTKPTSGKSLSDAFYEIKTANLSGEVLPVAEKIQELGQLVSGALPSLFGGQSPGGSKTAAVYSMSRAQSLQRLQTIWKILCAWWEKINGKVIPAYIKNVQEDERYVTRDKQGNFTNILIQKAELSGKLGSIELESNEQLPISWSQQKEIIMTLLQAANPEVMAAISSPENLPLLQRALGLTEFYMPGEDDREAQYDEINLLVQSEPIQVPGAPQQVLGPMGMQIVPGPPQEMPSVEVQPLVDNHQIHAEICRSWLVSDAGREARVNNAQGYKNVLLHMQQHIQLYQQSQMAQMQNTTMQQGPSSGDENKQNQNQYKPVVQPVNNNVNRTTQ